jgi:hypothetical protein
MRTENLMTIVATLEALDWLFKKLEVPEGHHKFLKEGFAAKIGETLGKMKMSEIENEVASLLEEQDTPKITWSNLKRSACPQCGEPITEKHMNSDVYMKHPCGFKIRLEKLADIVKQMDEQESDENKEKTNTSK